MRDKALLSIPEPLERHYSSQEIADAWGLDPSTVRRMFQERPGVLKIGRLPGAMANEITKSSLSRNL